MKFLMTYFYVYLYMSKLFLYVCVYVLGWSTSMHVYIEGFIQLKFLCNII